MLKLRPILLGGSVDLAGSTFFGTALGTIWARALQIQGVQLPHIYSAMSVSAVYSLAYFCIGTGFSLLGGYVAARSAGARYLLYGVASSIPCLLLGLLQFVSPFGASADMSSMVAGKIVSVTAGALGGYIAGRR